MFICVLVCVCTCMYFQFEETAFTLLRIMKYNIIYKSAWELLLKTQFQHYSVYAWSWGCHLQSCAFHAFHVFPALIAIGRYSMTIETVDVGWCKEITDRGATQIAQRSKSLRYLGLMRCDQVRSLFLSWCLILSVIVFVCVREAAGFMFSWTKMFSIHYSSNCSGVLCSHRQLKSHTEG